MRATARGELRRARITVAGLTVDRPTRTASYRGEPIELSVLKFALLDRLAAEPTAAEPDAQKHLNERDTFSNKGSRAGDPCGGVPTEWVVVCRDAGSA